MSEKGRAVNVEGILMDRPIRYYYASMRYFKEQEFHVRRICKEDVLVLVFDGVLRFSENGINYELHPGEYYIQRRETYQDSPLPSDAPKYLYVHFIADWGKEDSLPRRGAFDRGVLRDEAERLDRLAHSSAPYVVQCGAFYSLLEKLYRKQDKNTVADEIASFLETHLNEKTSLDVLCEKFHFSKNYIINLFKSAYGITPVAYVNQLKLEKAEYRMEVTSDSLEEIARSCGFSDYSHFYKLFVKKNGNSPEKWRAYRRGG